jgi:hypothetical protein
MSIKFHSIIISLLLITQAKTYDQPITIVLDPAEKTTSRIIDVSTEYGVTLQLCLHLKKVLEYFHPSLKIIITTSVAEFTQPYKKASLANTLQADLFLNFSCFYKPEGRPLLTIYRYGLNDAIDTLSLSCNYLSFIPYQKAHLTAFSITQKYARESINFFNAQYKKNFECTTLYACPLLPLKGIKVPALSFEMGLQNSNDWKLFVEPLVEYIKTRAQQITFTRR